jgi:hypothetical protein
MPSPINTGAARDLTISWLSQAESALVLDWAQEQEKKKAAKVAKAEEAAVRRRERQTKKGGTTASQLVAEAGLHQQQLSSSSSSSLHADLWSSSGSDDIDDLRRAEGLVPLDCDHAPLPFHRSCGVVFEQPASGIASASAVASNGTSAALPTTELPVGMDFYTALQKAWSRRPKNPPKLPPLASEADVNISDIDDALSGDSDYEELNPPVPLGLMISYFAEDWRESGLYDVVQRREEALTSQAQKR